MEPAAAAPSPAIAVAAAICTGTAPGRVHHQAARAATGTIVAATPSQSRPLPEGTDALPRSMRSWLSRAVLSSMRCLQSVRRDPWGEHVNINGSCDANGHADSRVRRVSLLAALRKRLTRAPRAQATYKVRLTLEVREDLNTGSTPRKDRS